MTLASQLASIAVHTPHSPPVSRAGDRLRHGAARHPPPPFPPLQVFIPLAAWEEGVLRLPVKALQRLKT